MDIRWKKEKLVWELTDLHTSLSGSIGKGCSLNGLSTNDESKGFRLLNSDEWIYLAGESTTQTIASIENSTVIKSSIGSTANEYGLYNFRGNVSEWIYDSGAVLNIGGNYSNSINATDSIIEAVLNL